jgi:hypothetical protein
MGWLYRSRPSQLQKPSTPQCCGHTVMATSHCVSEDSAVNPSGSQHCCLLARCDRPENVRDGHQVHVTPERAGGQCS